MRRIDNVGEGLRLGMRRLASGVCVITGLGENGEHAAMTASSVTSVSDQPPSLLVCINKAARMDYILSHSQYFCVNILSSDHEALSQLCATPDTGEERLRSGNWLKHEKHGINYIDDAPAIFICRKDNTVEHGTHNIYIANIEDVLVNDSQQSALLYADGRYHHL